jgi:GT2 family glycosyltransferase
MSAKKVTIIIPLPRFNDYIREAVAYYEILDYENFEIIILPDEAESEKLSEKLDIKIIPSGKVGPAEKRDLGAQNAKGEILAFTDDDAFPNPKWLKNALPYFEDNAIGAVGGPAVTPPKEKIWRKISGHIYASPIMSGSYRRRYVPSGKVCEDYDLPSVNLIIRKDVFLKVGGFDSTFYPGEDTKLCLEIKKLGYKIMYDPKVLVYHHRRALIPTHFKQIANYALHRGYFVRKYPETSRKFVYFLPSLFLMGLIAGGIASIFSPLILDIYLGIVAFYFLINLLVNFKFNPTEWILTVAGTFFSHLFYGFFFIKGLFKRELKR